MLLDKDLLLEVDPIAQFRLWLGWEDELVRVARKTVLLGKLATAIRIDGPGKRQIAPAHNTAEQRSRSQSEVFDVMPFAQRLTRSRNASDAD